ncbi:MAG: sugar phosphate isomerase/epimerase [Planctomycetota bacterium]|nr:sugar phosphate isomerase/epimerase [Planctomycetota bacterium]
MFKNLNCGAIGQKASFEEAVALAREFGFGGVDIDLGYAQEKGAAAVKDLLAQNNLKPGGIGFGLAFREKDSDKAWADSLANIARDAKLAAEIGVTRAATWVPPVSENTPFRQAFQKFVARIKPAAEIMGSYGIGVGLEFIGPRTLRQGKKYGFLYTMDGMRAACAAIGPNAGLLLDCWHWYTCQSTVTDLEQLEAGDVVYVHLNDAPSGIAVNDQVDNKRELPAATGVIDIKGFLGALKKIGYDGPLTVEPFNEPLKKLSVKDAVKATSESLAKAFKAAGV